MNQDIRIDVIKVADIFFAAHEELMDSSQTQLQYFLEHQVGFSVPSNLINFKFRLFYTYPDRKEHLLDILVENVFFIENLKDYISITDGPVTPEHMNIPSYVLIRMTDMCISHTRALLAKNKAATNFYDINPPYLDAKIVAKNFFREKISD